MSLQSMYRKEFCIWFNKCLSSVQLTPPQVEVQETPFNISWKSGYKNHIALREHIKYELLLQTSQGDESKVRSTVINSHTWTTCLTMLRNNNNLIVSIFSQLLHFDQPDTTYLTVKRSILKPGAIYCVKMRSKPGINYQLSIWSEWSQPKCVKNGAEKGKVTLFL